MWRRVGGLLGSCETSLRAAAVARRAGSAACRQVQVQAARVVAAPSCSSKRRREQSTTTSTKGGPPKAVAVPAPLQGVSRHTSTEELTLIIRQHAESKPTSGHVAFITQSLQLVDLHGIKPDVALYDAIFSVFPTKNRFRTESLLDAVWPRMTLQSECALNVLEHMEEKGVIPEASTHFALLQKFGKASAPVKKVRRLAYWMKRFAFVNPFALATPLPERPDERAKLALSRITGRQAKVLDLVDDCDDYVVAAHLPSQLSRLHESSKSQARLRVYGPRHFWFQNDRIPYACLVAEDHDDAILGVCLAHSLTREAVAVWLNGLDNELGVDLSHNVVSITLTELPADEPPAPADREHQQQPFTQAHEL